MRMTHVFCAMALVCVSATSVACDLPKLIMIPNADEVSGHEKEIRMQVGAYFTAMQNYVNCVKAELAADGGNQAPPLVKALLVQRNNVAVAEANAVVGWYQKNVGPLSEKGAAGDKK